MDGSQLQKNPTTLLEGLTAEAKKSYALKAFEKMLLTRLVDEKMGKLVRQNKGGTFHLGSEGHEMIGVLSAMSLKAGSDWAFPYYRDRAFAVGLGASLEELFAAFLARDIQNHSGGRQMPEHFSDKALNIPCQSSCVGSQFLQAAGVAKGIALEGSDKVVYVSGGDGSTSQGDFHETLNFACIHKLPLIIVIQDNGWAISVPTEEQTAGKSISKMASGYEGLSVFEINGCDFEETSDALEQAVLKARSKMGPSLVIAKVPRLSAHSSSDDPKKYKTQDHVEEDLSKDPLRIFESYLIENQFADLGDLEKLKVDLKEKVDLAASLADQKPFPEKKDAEKYLFQEAPILPSKENFSGESVVMMDALNHGLQEEMERDEGVIVFGQDVADGKGGVFGITRGLSKRFGENRCFNSPLAESTIVGLAIGLSLYGKYKPVVEIQFADYSWTAMNQIINELASIHYRSNGLWNCPIVIRMPYGGYIQGGPYHSQSIESYLSHAQGLKVLIPSNAKDAKSLLKSAIHDPNPVIFLEHKALYRQRLYSAKEEGDRDTYGEIGKAEVVREGTDVTFIGWGMTLLMGVESAEVLSKEGISVEVIDVKTIVPLDVDTLVRSLKKTGKVLIAHEAAKNSGFGAEILSRLSEEAFHYLDAPIVRVGAKNCPVPYSKELEDAVLPQKKDIEVSLRNLAEL